MSDYIHHLHTGYRLKEYELVRVLGSGGFGITYLGFDHHLDKPVAIKEYLPSDLAVRQEGTSVIPKSITDKQGFDWGLDRFLDEARTLARFDHRNICKIHRFFRDHGTGYIVMEYVEGETLAQRLKRAGRLAEDSMRSILNPLLDGLEQVHAAGFLHRDIKPGNIVIREDGSPVLIDFGAARQDVGRKSRSVTSIVTPGYAPIEQYSTRGNQGPWTDIYALTIDADPADANVKILNIAEKYQPGMLLPPGRYQVDVSKSGFGRKTQWVEITGAEQLVAVELDKERYALTVTTEPADAEVQFKNFSQNYQPGMLLPPGQYELEVSKTGFITKSQWVEITDSEQRIAVALEAEIKQPVAGDTFRDCMECPEMVVVPAGSFVMGSPASETGRSPDEGPQHTVNISSFAMGKYEISKNDFARFVQATSYRTDAERNVEIPEQEGSEPGCYIWTGSSNSGYKSGMSWKDPGFQQGDSEPVVCISWNDAQAYVAWISKETGKRYRLPSEAEWEYTARAGSSSAWAWPSYASQCDHANGADATSKARMPDMSWAVSCSDGAAFTAAAGRYQANSFGLYDMIGNVWEWAQDCLHDGYTGAPKDRQAWVAGGNCGERVLRGSTVPLTLGPQALSLTMVETPKAVEAWRRAYSRNNKPSTAN